MEQEPNARPADTVVYTDGAYDQAKDGGVQKAGFGMVVVRGGDGEVDADAKEIFWGWGQVQTDPASPTYLGAVEHTNNTAELTARSPKQCGGCSRTTHMLTARFSCGQTVSMR